jgi:hypothetical protein
MTFDRLSRHRHRAIACAGTVFLLSVSTACGTDSTAGADDLAPPLSDPSVEPTGKSYESPSDIVAAITADVVPCEANDPVTSTLYSDRAQTCWYTAADGVTDQMTAATYSNEAQLAKAIPYLQQTNPGAAYVKGNGWSVRTSQDLAEPVAVALDGEVVDPLS